MNASPSANKVSLFRKSSRPTKAKRQRKKEIYPTLEKNQLKNLINFIVIVKTILLYKNPQKNSENLSQDSQPKNTDWFFVLKF